MTLLRNTTLPVIHLSVCNLFSFFYATDFTASHCDNTDTSLKCEWNDWTLYVPLLDIWLRCLCCKLVCLWSGQFTLGSPRTFYPGQLLPSQSIRLHQLSVTVYALTVNIAKLSTVLY